MRNDGIIYFAIVSVNWTGIGYPIPLSRRLFLLRVIIVGFLAAIYFFSFYGWGHLIEQITRIRFPTPFTVCLGMACLIFVGGCLNLFGIAFPLLLDIIIFLGLVYTTRAFIRSWKAKSLINDSKRYLSLDYLARALPSAVLIAIVFIFSTYTQAPPKVFNLHDDFEKYLSHPVRMLTTGSLKGSQFNALGTETLGGQALLHGFAVSHWPIGYANAADSVLGLTLCLMIVLSAALRAGLSGWLIPLFVAIPFFINPQIVNVSATYTASALILVLFLGTWIELKNRDDSLSPWPNAFFVGLLYSALIALKTSYLFLPVIHFIALFFGYLCFSKPFKETITWGVKVIVSSIFFVSPWIFLYSSRWIMLLFNARHMDDSHLQTHYFQSVMTPTNLFSLEPLFYGFGATLAHYTFTIVLLVFCCFLVIKFKYPKYQTSKALSITAFGACATPPILYIFYMIMIAPTLSGSEASLRYLCPTIIAAVPTAYIISATAVFESIPTTSAKKSSLIKPKLLFALVSTALLVAFYGSFAERVKQAVEYGSILSFHKLAINSKYIAYNQFALSPEAKKQVQKAQQFIPEDKTLVAWTPLAFHLDYKRNEIIDVDPAGLTNPWLKFPFGNRTEAGMSYFKTRGIKYVLWQYRGYAVRSEEALIRLASSPFKRRRVIGVKTHQFVKFLLNLAKQSQILYNDGSIVVLKLPEQ